VRAWGVVGSLEDDIPLLGIKIALDVEIAPVFFGIGPGEAVLEELVA